MKWHKVTPSFSFFFLFSYIFTGISFLCSRIEIVVNILAYATSSVNYAKFFVQFWSKQFAFKLEFKSRWTNELFFFSVWNSFLRTRWTRPSCENCPSADGGVPFSEFKAVHRWVVSNNFIAEDITPIGASRIGHNHKVNRVLKHSILKVCMCILLKLPRVNRNFIHS